MLPCSTASFEGTLAFPRLACPGCTDRKTPRLKRDMFLPGARCVAHADGSIRQKRSDKGRFRDAPGVTRVRAARGRRPGRNAPATRASSLAASSWSNDSSSFGLWHISTKSNSTSPSLARISPRWRLIPSTTCPQGFAGQIDPCACENHGQIQFNFSCASRGKRQRAPCPFALVPCPSHRPAPRGTPRTTSTGPTKTYGVVPVSRADGMRSAMLPRRWTAHAHHTPTPRRRRPSGDLDTDPQRKGKNSLAQGIVDLQRAPHAAAREAALDTVAEKHQRPVAVPLP